MNPIRSMFIRYHRRLAGSTITEYVVIVAFVSIVGVTLLISIGQRTNSLLEQMNSNMPR